MPTVIDAALWAKKAGTVVLLDPAPAQCIPDDLLANADYVTPNETELAILTHTPPSGLTRADAVRKARELQAREVQERSISSSQDFVPAFRRLENRRYGATLEP